MNTTKNNIIEVYTDGATSNNGKEGAIGGWAFLILKDGEVLKEGKGRVENATNNMCEMLAIINGCNEAFKIDASKIIIYSDSSYCINCYLQKWYVKWFQNGWLTSSKKPVANKELWEELICFFENPYFDFRKVKGHSCNRWNNIVDKMAVAAKEI